MPPKNPMTEGEALAVLRRLKDALPDVGLNGWMEGVNAVDVAITALTAHTAASGGEVPEGRIRFDYTNADGRPDCKIITHDEMRQRYADLLEQKNGWPPPPAAAPADALTNAAEFIRSLIPTMTDSYNRELAEKTAAALIPKGADHEQR